MGWPPVLSVADDDRPSLQIGCNSSDVRWCPSRRNGCAQDSWPRPHAVLLLTGQAAALVAYTLISLASTALVLSIAAPWGGNWWYGLCMLSPAAGTYYLKVGWCAHGNGMALSCLAYFQGLGY